MADTCSVSLSTWLNVSADQKMNRLLRLVEILGSKH
jgi:hypothetical protein